MSAKISLLIVDDHALVRSTLAERLEAEPDCTVLGTACNAEEAIEQAMSLSPDVILMDIDMPGLVCFDAARTIATTNPSTRFVFLSAFIHDWYVEQALAVNASGYLTKREQPETVVQAIRKIASGGVFFSDEVRARIVVDSAGARVAQKGQSRTSTLTSREIEVLRYVARGLSKKEVAATMHLSVKTVDRHCANLMAKLDIHDRVDLARFAIREGLLNA